MLRVHRFRIEAVVAQQQEDWYQKIRGCVLAKDSARAAHGWKRISARAATTPTWLNMAGLFFLSFTFLLLLFLSSLFY
ncbi:hypothetical protein BDA96_03G195700 [Sorghum bicolor]|uniref:Uncharacterized protein n=2 Tax=Sorghum bicolor TaxID=4558 RepID=A0A921RDE8_SORBI|nr:hypothetical protein BDA96_03G195700 [Sorghum bicolor]OQU86963.1 hypothetical protein SORBI_3003G179950 [Sorghum bicolor]